MYLMAKAVNGKILEATLDYRSGSHNVDSGDITGLVKLVFIGQKAAFQSSPHANNIQAANISTGSVIHNKGRTTEASN